MPSSKRLTKLVVMEYLPLLGAPNQRFPTCLILKNIVPSCFRWEPRIFTFYILPIKQAFSTTLGEVTNFERMQISISHGWSCWYFYSILGTHRLQSSSLFPHLILFLSFFFTHAQIDFPSLPLSPLLSHSKSLC